MNGWYSIYVVFVQILSLLANAVVSSNNGYRSIACSNADHKLLRVSMLYTNATFHKSCRACFDFLRIDSPYLNRTNGIGMNAIEMKASVEDAQSTPR